MLSRAHIRVEDFEAVAMPLLPDLYRTARFLARRTYEADDLVQEVYLEAWKSYHRFTPGTNFRAWLFKILFHRLHHFRRRWVKASKIDALTDAELNSISAEPPVSQEIKDEEILLALEKVPVEFRVVLLLSDVQQFTYREVAETLNIPLGTVMSRLSRGRKQLRHELAQVAKSYGIGPGEERAG